jgi:MFS transporter, DHA2 family, multidrug resistance protein
MSATDRGVAPQPDYIPIPRHAGLLKMAIMLATLMQVLDMTIANVALPHMQAALGANQDSVSWVLTSYIVASAIAMPITGWLSDRIGRRRLYLWSAGGFVTASALCGMATNLESMVLFRIFQGVTGAFLSPLAQTVLLDSTPPEKRGQAMALFAMGVMVGPVLGPILGGLLTESLDWRWVFFVNLPLGALAWICLWFLLPDVKRPARSLDLIGYGTLAIGLAALQLMLDRGEHVDWFSSAEIWLELMIAVSCFWMFAVHIATTHNPLYPKDLLNNRSLLIGLVMMAILGLVVTSAMALMPIMLQGLFGYPVLDAGMLLASRGLGALLMTGISGRLVTKVDPRIIVVVGFAIIAFTLWEMTHWNLTMSWQAMAMNGFIQGLGLGMLFVPVTSMAFATLSAHMRTDAAGLLNLARSVGASIGISLMITLLARNSASSHNDLIAHLTPYKLWLDPGMLALSGDGVKTGLAMLNAEVTRQAAMIAFLDDYYIMMLISLCAMPLALLIGRPPGARGEPIMEIIE